MNMDDRNQTGKKKLPSAAFKVDVYSSALLHSQYMYGNAGNSPWQDWHPFCLRENFERDANVAFSGLHERILNTIRVTPCPWQ